MLCAQLRVAGRFDDRLVHEYGARVGAGWLPVGAGFHGMGTFSYIMEGFDAGFHGIGIFSYIMEGFDAGFHGIGFFSYIMEGFGILLP